MSSFGVSTTIEQDHRHSSLIFRIVSRRRLAGFTLQLRSSGLQADDEGLTAWGDLGGYKSGSLRLAWNRVRELHFAPPDAGELGGLYAREGAFCSRCVAPRLTETQTARLLVTLVQRFPALRPMVEADVEVTAHTPVNPYATSPAPLNFLSPRPTPHAPSFSHAVNPVLQSVIGRKHESARRIHRGAAGPL